MGQDLEREHGDVDVTPVDGPEQRLQRLRVLAWAPARGRRVVQLRSGPLGVPPFRSGPPSARAHYSGRFEACASAASTRKLTADRFVVAVGGRPKYMGLPNERELWYPAAIARARSHVRYTCTHMLVHDVASICCAKNVALTEQQSLVDLLTRNVAANFSAGEDVRAVSFPWSRAGAETLKNDFCDDVLMDVDSRISRLTKTLPDKIVPRHGQSA